MISASWNGGTAVSDNDRVIPGATGRAWRPNPLYQSFKESMAWCIRVAINRKFTGRVIVRLRVDLPPRMDTTAVIKAACDAVELSGAINNDSQIECLIIQRVGRSPRGHSRIDFEVEEM
jgi:Holliday junction resolvase RusA-like endonuclease